MAKVIEIDEAEYNRLAALQGIASKIVANPAARKRLEEAHKLVDPNASTPLLDQERQLGEPLNAMKSEFEAKLAKIEKEREDEKREAALAKIAADQAAGFARLRQQRYTDEGIAKIEEIMKTKGILDVDDAVAIFERTNPPATPATPAGGMTGSAWGFTDVNDGTDKAIQELIATKGQVDSVADRMAIAALSEFRGQARR